MERPQEKKSMAAEFVGLAKLWPYLRQEKRLMAVAVILIPVIAALDTGLPLILKYAIDHGIVEKDASALGWAAGAFAAVVLTSYFVRSGQSIAASVAVLRMIRRLRMKLFGHVLSLNASFHDRSMSGALVTRATSDFDNLSDSLNMGVLTSLVDVGILIGCVVGMFVLDWRLALTALVILPIVFLVVRYFSKAMKAAMLKARVKIAALNAYTQECFYGHQTVKILAGENETDRTYGRLNREFRDAQMSSVVLDALMFAVLDGIASITTGLALWFVVSDKVPGALLSAGVLVAFVQYVQQLFEPLKQLGNKMAMLQGAFTSIDRVFGVMAETAVVSGSTPVTKIEGDVEFQGVTFAYRAKDGGKGQRILAEIDLKLKRGRTLAIVGATGSGKSTLVKLLAKLYDGYEGKILLDGKDLAELDPETLRSSMAIVPQDIVLFDGTIAFNIGLGRPGITREDVADAAAQVGADDFIKRLPKGLDEEIKEQGSNLSLGQRQLIAFARALARKPGLVILDEATSSIDPESEATIQRAIAKILHGRTVIVIAHRLSTIRQCDEILVVDKGRVVEAGRHEELLAKQGAYFGLHQAFA